MGRPGSSHVTNLINEVLEHHGVKGQKWGVSRGGGISRKTGSNLHLRSPDAMKADHIQQKVKQGGVKAVSNEELQHLTTRMNLERQYSTLSSQSKKKNAGAKFVSDLLVGVAKQQVTQIATGVVAKHVAKALG